MVFGDVQGLATLFSDLVSETPVYYICMGWANEEGC